MRYSLVHVFRHIFIILIFFILAGCATFAGKDLPKYSNVNAKFTPPVNKPTVSYDVKTLDCGEPRIWPFPKNKIGSFLADSNSFKIENDGSGKAEYHFSFVLNEEYDKSRSIAKSAISVISLWIIPTYGRSDFTLSVDVTKNGTLIKQYQYKHYIDTYMQILLLPLTPIYFFPGTATKEVMNDMLKAFLNDMQNDKLLV